MAAKQATVQREYVLSDQDFAEICALVREHTGIKLAQAKRDLVYGRFSKRLRALGLTGFGEYCDLVRDGDTEELEHFKNAITTNLTSFFRESHHFDVLGQQILPDLLRRPGRRLRIWSAGCSTGEEPYSIAMTLLQHLPSSGWDVKILATDLDSQALGTAQTGIYPRPRLEGVSDSLRRRFFRKGAGECENKEQVRLAPEVRKLVTFKQLNLMGPWPIRGPFDAIFCRNVVIYFDKPTQRTLFERFADLQQTGASLFVGHSETLASVTDRYVHVGRTVYRKIR